LRYIFEITELSGGIVQKEGELTGID